MARRRNRLRARDGAAERRAKPRPDAQTRRRRAKSRPTASAILTILTLLWTAVGIAASPPAAADINLAIAVTTTADTVDPIDGLTSLREAVSQANATWVETWPPGPLAPKPDTITISLAVSSTYTLDHCGPTTADEDANATGDLDITVKPPLTILGNRSTVANACPGQRLFHRPDGNYQNTPLTLDHLMVTGGQGAPGLAIYHYGELTLVDTTVTMNQRPSNLGGGPIAAINFPDRSNGSPVLIQRSEISHTTGAAALTTAASVSSLTILESTVSDNTIPAGGYWDRSAGVNIGDVGTPVATIVSSSFRRNNVSGGSIPPSSWPTDLPPAPGSPSIDLTGSGAGALHAHTNRTELITITDSSFEENQGGRTGAVYGPFTIARSLFRGNVGKAESAVSVSGAITDSTFENNQAVFFGAAYSTKIRRSSFIGNKTGGGGAAVSMTMWPDLLFLIEDTTFVDNIGRSAGAILVINQASTTPPTPVEIRNATFAHNRAVLTSGNRASDIFVVTTVPTPVVKVSRSVLGSSALPDAVPSCSRGTSQTIQNAAMGSGGGNVFTDSSCVTTLDPTDVVVGDAMIGPVTDNGGPTPTAAPFPGSPVIDHIAADDPACADPEATDQRGQPRHQGVGCDAGAVEIAYGGYHPVTPTRIYDSRPGGDTNRLGPGEQRTITVTGPTLAAPANAMPVDGVAAVVLNVTTANTTADSHLTIWPTGLPPPPTSTLNWTAGAVTANLATVTTDPATGTISVRNNNGFTHLILDIAGWYDTGTTDPNPLIVPPTPTLCPCGDALHPVTPTRIFDTRNGTGTSAAAIAQGQTRDAQIAGTVTPTATVPSNATAAVINLTGINPTTDTHLTAWPKGTSTPTVSNVNVTGNRIAANLAIVPIGTDGKITIRNNTGQIHVIVDIVAYTAPGAGPRYHPVTPTRIDDTRDPPPGNPPPGAPLVAGIPRTIAIPAAAIAVNTNLTGTQTSVATHLTVWPFGQLQPGTSTLNLVPGQTRAIATITPTTPLPVGNPNPNSAALSIVTHSGTTHAITDLNGWYA